MNHFSDSENKGQYCQFVKAADGSYVLEPVRVPAHIKEEQKARMRKREMRRRVERNRERAQAINGRSLLFMSVALIFFVLICCAFLYVQFRLTNRMEQIARLQTQIEQLAEDNDTLENRLLTSHRLNVVAAVATKQLGMRHVEVDQIRYYHSDQPDYMIQYQSITDKSE